MDRRPSAALALGGQDGRIRRSVPRRRAIGSVRTIWPFGRFRILGRSDPLPRMRRVFHGIRRVWSRWIVPRLARRMRSGRIVGAWLVHVRYLSLLVGEDFFSSSRFGAVERIGFLSFSGDDFEGRVFLSLSMIVLFGPEVGPELSGDAVRKNVVDSASADVRERQERPYRATTGIPPLAPTAKTWSSLLSFLAT